MKTLETYRELAYRAHTGTSFSPEQRAERIISDYSEQLDSDIEKLRTAGTSEESIENYKAKYISLFTAWLRAKGNCISSMIAGPSKFPVRRAEKANRAEENKYEEFSEYRENYFKRAAKIEKKQEIEAAGGELGVARKKLEDLKAKHEYMKKVNKAYTAYKKNPQSLIESGLSEEAQKFIIQWVPQYSFERTPFQGYSLTNNLAKIKSTEARVKELESKEEKASSGENKEIKFPGGVCVYDYTLDRITIKHDQKPSAEVISEIKSHGFRWSPFHGVWMRKITNNAAYVTEKLLLPKFK